MAVLAHRPVAVGDRIDNGSILIDSIIDQGGQGIVYAAHDKRTGQPLAIKQLAPFGGEPSEVDIARFRRTARIRIGHPAVLDPLRSFEENGNEFIVFDYLEGKDLSQVIKGGRLRPSEALRIIKRAAEGLGAAHKKRLVHRDIKPANLFLQSNGEVRVIDFGIALHIEEDTPGSEDKLVGSPRYMAPEQAKTPWVDPRADCYALGLVLWELLTGKPARSGQSDTVLLKEAVECEIPPLSSALRGVTADLETLCIRVLERDRRRRLLSARDLVDEIDRIVRGCVTARCFACGNQIESGARYDTCGNQFSKHPLAMVVSAGPSRGEQFLIPDGTYAIGRHQLSPSDRTMSREQLVVSNDARGLWIRGVGGIVPVLINGTATGNTTCLRAADTVRFGELAGTVLRAAPFVSQATTK